MKYLLWGYTIGLGIALAWIVSVGGIVWVIITAPIWVFTALMSLVMVIALDKLNELSNGEGSSNRK